MDTLDFAIRRYQQLVPELRRIDDHAIEHDLLVWLQDDVAGNVETLTRQPSFREHASWVLRALHPQAETAERSLINRLESAIRATAIAYTRLLKSKQIAAKLKQSYSHCPYVVEEEVLITGTGPPQIVKQRMGHYDAAQMLMGEVQYLASRQGRIELVDTDDYFNPRQHFVEYEDGSISQIATHIVSLTPKLHAVGNFVLRGADVRLNDHLHSLDQLRSALKAIHMSARQAPRTMEGVRSAWLNLDACVQEFRHVFQTGATVQLVDACMALTQVYAAFHPSPDLSWLNLTAHHIESGQSALKQRFRGQMRVETFERVWHSLKQTRHLYRDSESGLSDREEAIARGNLVLVEASKVLYWEAKSYDFSEGKCHNAWRLLVALAKKAQRGMAVTQSDFYSENAVANSAMATAKMRLAELLPASLKKQLVPGPEARSYQLKVERAHIRIE